MFRMESTGLENYGSADQKFNKVSQHRSANSFSNQFQKQCNNDSLEKMPFPICQEESFIEPDQIGSHKVKIQEVVDFQRFNSDPTMFVNEPIRASNPKSNEEM
jgi:hypothetical protein